MKQLEKKKKVYFTQEFVSILYRFNCYEVVKYFIIYLFISMVFSGFASYLNKCITT